VRWLVALAASHWYAQIIVRFCDHGVEVLHTLVVLLPCDTSGFLVISSTFQSSNVSYSANARLCTSSIRSTKHRCVFSVMAGIRARKYCAQNILRPFTSGLSLEVLVATVRCTLGASTCTQNMATPCDSAPQGPPGGISAASCSIRAKNNIPWLCRTRRPWCIRRSPF
jgi:hypothetical protein